jgi:hypothetical protein
MLQGEISAVYGMKLWKYKKIIESDVVMSKEIL